MVVCLGKTEDFTVMSKDAVGAGVTKEEALEYSSKSFPTLKRWMKS